MASIPTQPAAPSQSKPNSLARMALFLSVVAFLLPLGIAAVVMGHIAERQAAPDDSTGHAMARAALWISYLQLASILLIAVLAWGLFAETAQGFRGDALVQRVFRSNDATRPLDRDSARDAEVSAQAIAVQLVAIEDQIRRHREDGGYSCQLNEVLETGLEGSTDAEKKAFALRLLESPYIFQISRCNPQNSGIPEAAYVLTAVPRTPRMPEDSALFCTDQTGVVRQVRGGISLDCLKNGQPLP